MLPYYLGCPGWSEPAWRTSFYPAGIHSADMLSAYAEVFNTVEGNTTFYAAPSEQTVARWAQQMPEHFRFCAKFPQTISHAGDLSECLASIGRFRQLLAPLGARVAPFWLQLPASFSPARLPELEQVLSAWDDWPLAVEVRHPGFFDRGDGERALNRLLRDRQIERVCFDSRALFSCPPSTAAVRHAQSRKPRLPLRPAALSRYPQIRFIGHPELPANDSFLAPWLDKVAHWIEQDLQPYVFLHTPDNHLAPLLAQRFHRQLCDRLPGLPALPDIRSGGTDEQLGLL